MTKTVLKYIERKYTIIILISTTEKWLRFADKDQKVFNFCTTDINSSDFNNSVQVIITSVTKY